MPSLKIVSNDLHDTATVTATPTGVATLPVTNTQINSRSEIFRSTSVTSQEILIDFTELSLVDSLGLTHCNFTTVDSIRWQLYDGAGGTGTELYDSGTVDIIESIGWGYFDWGGIVWGSGVFDAWADNFYTSFLGDSYLALSAKITLTSTSAKQFDISRIYIGHSLSPSCNFVYGYDFAWNDNVEQFATDGGTLRSDSNGTEYRTMSFALETLNEAERGALADFFRRNGKRQDSLYQLLDGTYGENAQIDYTTGAKLTEAPTITSDFFNNFNVSLSIRET